MFGIGERFAYARCGACGCLQIDDLPKEMGRYYPGDYYSYCGQTDGGIAFKHKLRSLLSLYGPAWAFAGHDWWERGDRKSLRDAGVSRSDRILDIGCGAGELIAGLRDIGFRNVVGADPFIPKEIVHRNGARVLKCDASDLEGGFDLVMMHHSLEHIWDQSRMVGEVARLLVPGGRCIIRIPTIDSWAWQEYGTDWVQLDAPRHFYLHSRTSIVRLLQAAGLEVTALVDDSSAFQVLGSEKIRRGFPLINPATGATDYATFLSRDVVASARRRARDLNKAGRGDAIAVHARKRELCEIVGSLARAAAAGVGRPADLPTPPATAALCGARNRRAG